MYKIVLVEACVRELEDANVVLSKRRKAKRRYIQTGGPLTVQDVAVILDDKDIQEQLEEEIRDMSGRTRRTVAGLRHCSTCGKIGHNARTC